MYNKQTGNVLELFISVKGEAQRSKKERLILNQHGVREDKFFGKNQERSILLTSVDSYNLAKRNNIHTPYGSLGENILLSINPYSMIPGDRLQIGEILLEITQNCTLCNSLSKVDKSLPELLKTNRGIFAKAINEGVVKQGDKVTILK